MNKTVQIIIAAFFSLTFFIVLKSNVYAIPVSPDKYFIDVAYNQTVSQELTIYGREQLDNAKKIYVYAVGMIKEGEENERSFYLPDKDNQAEAANWIKIDRNEYLLSAGQTLKIPWHLTPTPFASCGTNLAAIMISTEPIMSEVGGTKVTIKKEIISQVHINIKSVPSGDCANSMSDLEFIEFNVDQALPIFNNGDVPFITKIKNNGNLISRSPKGYIEIYGLGPKVTLDFNSATLDIYPGTVRKFSDLWLEEGYPKEGSALEQLLFELTHFRFGRYEARLGITKNVDKQIVASTYFWIIPWKVILLLIAVLLIVYVTIIRPRYKKK